MIKADKRTMEAFVSPAGQVIRDFLDKCAQEKTAESLEAESTPMYRAQGAAIELNEIVKLAKNSRDILNST